MHRLTAVALVCLVLAMVTACASAPSQFYTLNSTTAPAATVSAVSLLSVAVGPVAVPAAVDRPQIVLSVGANPVSDTHLDVYKRQA